MTGGQALVGALHQHGVDTVFGLPGVQLDWLFNAFHDRKNQVRVIHSRHEQGVAYMAYGYAQASGRVGTYAVVPGPGVLNTTAALATAYACNSPVLCLTGQIHSAHIGRGVGQLHEIPDQLGVIERLTKWSARANHPTEIPGLVREAFRQMGTGRPRPAGLEVPPDILQLETDVDLGSVAQPEAAPEPDSDAIARAAKLLGEAKRPMIFVGSGCWDATEELLALAEMLQAPVIASRNGIGAIDDRNPLSQKLQAAWEMWATADVVLGVGTRLSPNVPSWGVDADLKIIRMDIDPVEVTRNGKPDVGIVTTAKRGLVALADAVAKVAVARPSRTDELKALQGKTHAFYEEKLAPQMSWINALRRALPDDVVLVDELTQIGYVARVGFPCYRPRSYITSGYQGTLGFGFATALGAKVACPDRPVVSITGDGGFMFNVQELSTAVQNGIHLITVVFADGAFGNVQRMQRQDYGDRVIATELHNPDFVKLAESFGAQGARVDTPAELEKALARALREPGPWLIEARVGRLPDPWPVLGVGRARGRK
ncbi:thiamine pyrophosphate-dependent enzyme [Allostella humosa]|nr:thiamine pyrophosphate-dependent enzyme [Stella humosa]